jgi:ubiquinone/menaquinone biosynthesis C-methylase UbiE
MITDWSEYYDNFVKNSKDDINNIYYSNSIEHNENINKVFNAISSGTASVVLDAGCGVGNFIIPLSYKCKLIYGIDISNESLKICSSRVQKYNIKNVILKNSTVLNIPLNDSSVDKILCFSIFQYLDSVQIETAIEEFKRILKEDGLLIINFLNGDSLYDYSTKVLRFIRKILKGKRNYASSNIPLKQLKDIIEKEKGTAEIIHSAYFYPRLFPGRIIKFIQNRFYYERFLPGFLQKYGLSITLKVQFKN